MTVPNMIHLQRDPRTQRTCCGLHKHFDVPSYQVAHHKNAFLFTNVCSECLNRNALYDLAAIDLGDSEWTTIDFWDPTAVPGEEEFRVTVRTREPWMRIT